eukprot:3458365-Rhodomonas_salina.1
MQCYAHEHDFSYRDTRVRVVDYAFQVKFALELEDRLRVPGYGYRDPGIPLRLAALVQCNPAGTNTSNRKNKK